MKQPSFFIDIYDNAYYNKVYGNLSTKKEWLNMDSKPFTKKPHILIFGEVLIDEIIDQHGKKHPLVGGSAANVAVNLEQLGIHTTFIGAYGNDAYGDLIQMTLKSYGVDTSYLQSSTLNTSIVRMNQSVGSPIPTFERGSDFDIKPMKDLDHLLDTVDIFHFTYWPLSKNPAKTTLLDLIKRAKKKNILLGFDPNIHPDLISDSSLTNEEQTWILNQVDFIKPSMDDLSRLYQEEFTKTSAINKLSQSKIPWIIVTLGKEGVLVYHDDTLTEFPALAKDIIDSTGAGDAFISGFYASYLHNQSLTQMIKDAQTMSALVLSKLGAMTHIPHYNNLHKGDQ